MKAFAATAGLGGVTTVLAASSVAVVNQSKKKNTAFNDDVSLSYRKHFHTPRVNRDTYRYSLLPITKGACFASFFPGANLPRRPEKSVEITTSDASDLIPTGFTLQAQTNPVGCKLMKMSKTQDAIAFGYLSETAVQSGKYGLAFYAAATNLKQKTYTDMEYWLLFMEKKGFDGTIIKGIFGSRHAISSNGSQQAPFTVTLPGGKETGQWTPASNKTPDLEKLINAELTDTATKWNDPSRDKLSSRLWFGGQQGEAMDELFHEGSNEKGIFKEFKDHKTVSPPGSTLPFFKKIHLDQRGAGKDLKTHCESLKLLQKNSFPHWEQHICFPGHSKS